MSKREKEKIVVKLPKQTPRFGVMPAKHEAPDKGTYRRNQHKEDFTTYDEDDWEDWSAE